MYPTRYRSRNKMLLIALLVIIALIATGYISKQSSSTDRAFVDHALKESNLSDLSVIVTGNSAAAAIEAVGGTVTSDLWLINAAGGTVPRAQLDLLATARGVESVVGNYGVSAADAPPCAGGVCASRPGWVTDRREKRAIVELPHSANVKAQIVQLPDGRFVGVAEKEVVVFVGLDGEIETILTDLNFEKMKSAPTTGPDGSVYFVAEETGSSTKTRLFAINSDGTLRYSEKKDKMLPGAALSPDGQRVYVSGNENKAKLYVFDAQSGDLLDEIKPKDVKAGLYELPPVVGPDGMVYLQSTGKEPHKDDRRSNLIALDPASIADGNDDYAWRYVAVEEGDLLRLDYQPVVANGQLYAFSEHDKKLFAFDAVTGAPQWTVDLPKKPETQPTAGDDGTIYIPADKHWYAYNPNGTLRFDFVADDGKFGQPAFSADGETIYIAAKKNVYAIDSATGSELWTVRMKGDIEQPPQLNSEGSVILGSKGKDVVIVKPNGHVTSRLRIDHEFGQVVSADMPDGSILLLSGDKQLVTVDYLPETYDDALEDAQPTDIKDEWELANPIAIDVGADALHETELMLPDEDGDLELTAITGEGVMIAVLDSGVYVDGKVKDLLSSDVYSTDLKKQFVGQYDFVGDGFDPRCDDHDYNSAEGYCYYKWDKSHDDYGHGSHVAGIIWSQITDYSSGVSMGIAPGAEVVSIRVLDGNGNGTYEDVIEGIQFAVAGVDVDGEPFETPIRILNLSLSAYQQVPYFVDPLNRAVEEAWAAGLVVLAAAGNEGPGAQTITVPGNDPYIITVGAVNNQRTPGYWADDEIPSWSASGPTLDGFVKPDVVAPGSHIVSFMHNDDGEVAQLLVDHPDYSETISLFRMNGTSMATGVTSGVVALMLQANPDLTPDEVKFRLMYTAAPALVGDESSLELGYGPLEQGAGRVWAPAAVLADNIPDERANANLDLAADLAHPWTPGDSADPAENPDMAYHYEGPVQQVVSDDGETVLFYMVTPDDGAVVALGAAEADSLAWRDSAEFIAEDPTFFDGAISHDSASYIWGGASYIWGGASYIWGGASYIWGGASYIWGGASYIWGSASYIWGGASYIWGGASYIWGGASYIWGGNTDWNGGLNVATTSISTNKWIDDPRPEGFTVHSADLDMHAAWVSADTWQATVGITVRDEHHARVADVLVDGVWSDGTPASCVTDLAGLCSLVSPPLNESVDDVTFSLSNLTHATQTYAPADNIDYEADSDGSTIQGEAPSYRPSMHVADIDAASSWSSGSEWAATITMTVMADTGELVPDATVTAEWIDGLDGSITCYTDSNGQCAVAATAVDDETDKIKLKVLHIDHALRIYEHDDNDDPDGDSNGEQIEVKPPVNRPSLHIADLDAASAWISSTHWSSVITFTVENHTQQRVSDASIVAQWTEGLSGTVTCVTDAVGQCAVAVNSLHEDVDKLKLEVDDIVHPVLAYEDDHNDDPDNDSDGEKIQVEPPDYRPGMQVAALSGTGVWLDAATWQATFTVTVLDDAGLPVSDAMVFGRWKSGPSGDATCVTGASGTCTIVALVDAEDDKAEFETRELTHQLLVDNDEHDTERVNRPD